MEFSRDRKSMSVYVTSNAGGHGKLLAKVCICSHYLYALIRHMSAWYLGLITCVHCACSYLSIKHVFTVVPFGM